MVFRRRSAMAVGDPLHIAYRRIGKKLFVARLMPELLSQEWEP